MTRKKKEHTSQLSTIQAAGCLLLPKVSAQPSHLCLPKCRNTPAQTAEPVPKLQQSEGPAEHPPHGAQQQNELLSPGWGSCTPGPAHRPSHNPLGKGQGQAPEDVKAGGSGSSSFASPALSSQQAKRLPFLFPFGTNLW